MQLNQHIERMARPWCSAKMLNDRCSGFFFNDMGRGGVASGGFRCSGRACDRLFVNGRGVKAGLIAPTTNNQQDSEIRRTTVSTTHHGVPALTMGVKACNDI
jgi:hypothetical protein